MLARVALMSVVVLAPMTPAAAQDNVPGVIARFRAKDPRVARAFDEAYGYVVFRLSARAASGSVEHGAKAGSMSAGNGSAAPRSRR
jgi:hypothetical protein